MKIESLGKSLIPLVYESHEVTMFELMIHAIEIKNNSLNITSLRKITLSLELKNEVVATIVYDEKRLKKNLKSSSKVINTILDKNPVALSFLFSKNHKKFTSYCTGPELIPDSKTLLRGVYFFLKNVVPTKLRISVEYNEKNKKKNFEKILSLKQYRCKNKYIFPLKGIAYALNGPATGVSHHRQTTSQEFGYDIALLGKDGKVWNNRASKNTDFPTYGAKIIAPADGKIIIVKDGLPENTKIGEAPPLVAERTEKWGWLHAAAGNVIVIKHKFNEYSFIAHCIPDSIKVKEGQKIKQGQTLANLGNSGNSTGPHLHYHLMDGDNFMLSRSLPITFSNIIDYPVLDPDYCEFLASKSPLIKTTVIKKHKK